MDNIKFEWDINKAQKNIEKHGITFQEASTVFADEDAILFDDPEHSVERRKVYAFRIKQSRKNVNRLPLLPWYG